MVDVDFVFEVSLDSALAVAAAFDRVVRGMAIFDLKFFTPFCPKLDVMLVSLFVSCVKSRNV